MHASAIWPSVRSAALERAHAAAAAAARHRAAKELFDSEIFEGRSLERHQYRTHLRLQNAVELLKIGIDVHLNGWRALEGANWNHHEGSTGRVDFQHPRYSNVVPHARKVWPGKAPIEVRGSINNQCLSMLLKHLLLQNGDRRRLTATVVSGTGVSPEDAKARIGRQLRIDVADGGEKVGVHGSVPNSVVRLGCGPPNLRELGRRYVFASNVAVQRRLLRSAAELHYDRPDFLREVGIPDQRDS